MLSERQWQFNLKKVKKIWKEQKKGIFCPNVLIKTGHCLIYPLMSTKIAFMFSSFIFITSKWMKSTSLREQKEKIGILCWTLQFKVCFSYKAALMLTAPLRNLEIKHRAKHQRWIHSEASSRLQNFGGYFWKNILTRDNTKLCLK